MSMPSSTPSYAFMPMGMWPVTVMPSFVGVRTDGLHVLRFHRAVDLHLLEAGVVITLSPTSRASAGEFTRVMPIAYGTSPSTIPASSMCGPSALPLFTASRTWVMKSILVAHIAHRGDARREIDRSPLHLLVMRVHVPQAGNDVLAGTSMRCASGGNLHVLARTDCDNLTVAR